MSALKPSILDGPATTALPDALCQAAVERGVIGAGDVLAIRDLLELSGYTGEPPALHALLIAMFSALNDGSLCVPLDEVSLRKRLGEVGGDTTAQLVAGILQNMKHWPELIGRAGEFKPLVCVTNAARTLLYFQRYHLHEARVREQIALRRAEPPGPSATRGDGGQTAVLDAVLQQFHPRGGGFELSSEQKDAVAGALSRNFLIVSGGPGTGKTTIVVTILRCLLRMGIDPGRIGLAAPTGRAANRMTESIRKAIAKEPRTPVSGPATVAANPNSPTSVRGYFSDGALMALDAQTIHRLLQYHSRRHEFAHHAGNLLPIDCLIVDEASMVDVTLMSRLLEAAPPEARVILIGDRDQLPSVEAGAVLADLMPRDAVPGGHVVILERSHRLDEGLRAVAVAVREGRSGAATEQAQALAISLPAALPQGERGAVGVAWPVPLADDDSRPKCSGGGYRWMSLKPNDYETWPRIVDSWAAHQYLERNPLRERAYADLIRDARATLRLGEEGVTTESKTLLDAIFDGIQQAQILTLIRNGPFGCTGINALMNALLRPQFTKKEPRTLVSGSWSAGAFPGLPILITRNNHDLDLYNGDIGVVLSDEHGSLHAFFQRVRLPSSVVSRASRPVSPGTSGGTPEVRSSGAAAAQQTYIRFALDTLPPWEPAFAITVHKSQGSEYEQVLLVVPPEYTSASGSEELPARKLLTREIVYTGLTRAKYLAVLCGSEKMIRTAIENRIERQSGLAT